MHNIAAESLRRVGQRLRDRSDDLLGDATAQILASIPAYKQLVPHDDLLQSGRNVLNIVLEALMNTDEREGGAATRGVVAEIGVGRRRFRQGVALEDLLRAIRFDFTVLWDALCAEAAAEADPAGAVSLGALRIWKALDEAMLQITEGYRREEAAQDRAGAIRRHRAMAELIDAHEPSIGMIARTAQALEFDQGGRFLAAVGRLPEEASHRLEAGLRSLGAASYVGIHGADVVAVASWSQSGRHVISQIAGEHCIVVAPQVYGVHGIPAAVRLARAALHGTPKDRTGVLQARDLLVEAITAEAAEIAASLADEVLAPLNAVPAGERARLVETLQAWAETDGTVSAVAQQLYRHRNTITNHLRRIQDLTGLSFNRPRDAATLVVALRSIAHR